MKLFRNLFTLFVSLYFSLCTANSQLTETERLDILKNLDIYNSVFKELSLYFVDSIAFEKTIHENIDFMLQRLDPYTEYIPEEEMSDFMLQTTGEYGGIGAIINSDSTKIFISEPYEGMPAAEAGLIAGDVLLEINGESLANKKSDFASERLKGRPNTKVKIKYRRIGEWTREETITRRLIEINPVTYYGVLPSNIGYICLSSFTTHSARSVRDAINDLKQNRGITSLIIDLRDNSGGVVEDCIEILNLFIPRGQTLLTMKSKAPLPDKVFRTLQDAVEPEMPVAVLVNQMSASASEIFAGAMQDLDRGTVIGNRTFGKGLVQTSRPLPYNGQLKLTVAKYYIPSGRCIQAINYSHRNEDGSVSNIPDSLTHIFHTAKGREVKDGGGITPDIIVENKQLPTMLYYLDGQNIFFNFAVEWRQKHPKIDSPETFVLSEETYLEFISYVKSKDFKYDIQSEKALDRLKEIMKLEGYMDTAADEFKALENLLKPDLERDLYLYRDQISDFLSTEIMRQYYLAKGEIIYSLRNDDGVKKATEVLTGR
ncbi:MAG: S41 family peptidase [Dysgonamonadaceae bacterium]|jgi:carboxyl-terminal processing protease|nr:S41 family peptidase [Dysgonamonadaceae bacterium]